MTHAVSTNGHGAGLALVEPAPQLEEPEEAPAQRFWVCAVTLRVAYHVGYGCQFLGRTTKRGHEECGWFSQDPA